MLEQLLFVSWDSALGIATRSRLDGPGIESRWGRDFPHPPRPALEPTRPPIQWIMGPSSTEVKERLELYIYCPCGPLWPVLGSAITVNLWEPTE